MYKLVKEIPGCKNAENRRTVMIVALLGMYMAVLDSVIISIALPTITSYFNADIVYSQWAMTGYLVAMTSSMLIFARLSANTGKNRMFLSGMALFTLSSLACAFAPSLPALIVFRILQGVGGAMSVSIVMAIIFELYSFSEHGKAMGLLASTIAIASLSGPFLGGFLLEISGWPAIFLINIPIGILLVFFGIYSMDLKKKVVSKKDYMDWTGAGTLAVAIASSLIFLGFIADDAGNMVCVAVSLLICLLSLSLFIRTESSHPNPLLDLSVFSERKFVVPLLCMVLFFTALLVMYISLPFYLEGVMAFSPLQVGEVFILIAAILTVGSPVVGKLFDRFQWKYYTTAGLFIAAGGLSAMAFFAGAMDLSLLIGALIIFTIGFTLFQSPINTEIMRGLPLEKSAVASGLNSAGRHYAMALGSSVASLIFAFQLHGAGYAGILNSAGSSLIADATMVAMIVAAGLCFAGVLLLVAEKNSGGEKQNL